MRHALATLLLALLCGASPAQATATPPTLRPTTPDWREGGDLAGVVIFPVYGWPGVVIWQLLYRRLD